VQYAELRAALAIEGGAVVVDPARLTPNLNALWRTAFGGARVRLGDARPGPGDGEGGAVVVAGTGGFLEGPPVPVVLRATLDASGDAHVCFRYGLRPAEPGPGAWTFSASLPGLPTAVDAGAGRVVLLDRLDLFDSWGVIADEPDADPAGVPLQPGINFVSQMRPGGLLSSLATVFGQSEAVTLFGTIVLPGPDEPPLPPLPESSHPWDLPGPIPGILLRAALTQPTAPLGGRLVLEGVDFRLYSGPSLAWQRRNPTYGPVQGYTGTLTVPSAALTLRTTAELELGSPSLVLVCDLGGARGLSRGLTLADLADLTGTAALAAALPGPIQEAAAAAGALALTEASLGLSASGGVDFAYCAGGFPAARWPIWEPTWVVSDVVARFRIARPFSGPEVSVEIGGTVLVVGTPALVAASTAGGFTVTATLGAAARLPLVRLLQEYAPGVPAPSDLVVDRLDLTVVPGTSYEMQLAMAEEPNPWIIPVGPASLRVSGLQMGLRYAGGLSGAFSGHIAVGGADVAIHYTIPGDVEVRGTFPAVRLSQLLTLISGPAPLPPGFDLDFERMSLLVRKRGEDLTFQAATDVAGFGLFALEVRRGSGGWGCAAGLDLGSGRTAQLPALGPLAPLLSAVDLDGLVLVLSTFDDPGFTFPDASAFDDPALHGALRPAGGGGVHSGFNFFGTWRLDPNDRFQSLLRDVLGLEELALVVVLQVSLPDPGQDSSLFAAIEAVIAGWALRGRFGARIRGETPELFASGTLRVQIQGQERSFYVESSLVANGVVFSGSLTGGSPVTISMQGVELFQIGNLAVAVGANFEGIPSFGVAGTIAEGGFSSSLAVFVNAAEPQKSLVAGAISDLCLGDVLRTLTGGAASDIAGVLDQIAVAGTRTFQIPAALAADLDGLRLSPVAAAFAQHGVTIPGALPGVFLAAGRPGETWFLTALTGNDEVRHYSLQRSGAAITVTLQAQLYCVPETTSLGELTFRGPQFFINGMVELFGLQAQATITVEPSRGFALDASMAPIVIFRPSFFSVTATGGAADGPRVSGATFAQPDQADPALRPAHLLIDGRVQILGLERHAYVAVTEDGFTFDLGGNVQPAVTLDARGSFRGLEHLAFGGTAAVGVGRIDLGPLGSVSLEGGAEARLDVGYGSGAAWARMGVGFRFAGTAHRVTADLDVTGAQLADIAGRVAAEIRAFFERFWSDAGAWMQAVAGGLVQGVDDAVAVLRDVFHKTETEALTIYNDAMEAAQRACAMSRAVMSL
jgi:hypothetical protein